MRSSGFLTTAMIGTTVRALGGFSRLFPGLAERKITACPGSLVEAAAGLLRPTPGHTMGRAALKGTRPVFIATSWGGGKASYVRRATARSPACTDTASPSG